MEYFVYGHKLISNVALHMLTPFVNQPVIGDIKLLVYNKETFTINSSRLVETSFYNNKCILRIGDKVKYSINSAENVIKAKTCNLVWMESTLLNLPFALFFAAKGMILLHASALINHKNVIPICATKGTGKTTVSVGLSRFYNFYSDDTILVRLENGRLQCYFGTRYVRLKRDSFETFAFNYEFNELRKNVQGKAYYNLGEKTEELSGDFDKLFFLKREGTETKANKIVQPFKRKLCLHMNVCGTFSLGYAYCKMVENSDVFHFILSNTEFVEIVIRDDLTQLIDTIENVKILLDNTMKPKERVNEC